MSTAANKRSVMVLYASASDIYSHQVKIVLAEKGVPYSVEYVDPDNPPEDLLSLNPYGSLPTLVDRDLVLFNSRIIVEYLDERFPHPPLMPVYPVTRGKSRLYMMRIKHDWYPILAKAEQADSADRKKLLQQLTEEVLAIAPIFGEYDYFMSEEFSLIDCYMAPLLWRMQLLGAEFKGTGSKAVKNYINRIFSRDAFVKSVESKAAKNPTE